MADLPFWPRLCNSILKRVGGEYKVVDDVSAARLKYVKRSYSQYGEDLVLASAFAGKLRSYKGFYIDVGAHHPFRFSNTQFFYEKGWRGINIDATPNSMDAFAKHRPEDINLELGVTEKEGELEYYLFNESALNTFSKERADELIAAGSGNLKEVVKVQTQPLTKILDAHVKEKQHIDFLSIDIEGVDFSVLKTLDFRRYAPSFILIEDWNFSFENGNESASRQFLLSKGYKLVGRVSITSIYSKK